MNITHNNTCKMSFGRPSKHNDCPRCEELKSGSSPRKGWGSNKREMERLQSEAIWAHDCKKSNCSTVCTFGDW